MTHNKYTGNCLAFDHLYGSIQLHFINLCFIAIAGCYYIQVNLTELFLCKLILSGIES